MSDPRQWAVVEALAGQLLKVDFIDAEDAWPIMAEAWGGEPGLPIREMGRKWRRRFFPPMPKAPTD